MLLIVAIDVPFQLWDHDRKLKMTREEVRQEDKETEGDPQVKARIRSLQREMARRRMMAEIPKADVVVTNPTHYAVALRYQGDTMRAPRGGGEGRALAGGAHPRTGRRAPGADARSAAAGARPVSPCRTRRRNSGNALYRGGRGPGLRVTSCAATAKTAGRMPQPPRELPVPAALDPSTGLDPGADRPHETDQFFPGMSDRLHE